MRTELTRRCGPPIELLPDIEPPPDALPPDPLPGVLPPAVLPEALPPAVLPARRPPAVPAVPPPAVLPEGTLGLTDPLAPPDMLESTVPVTSTLWPTCF